MITSIKMICPVLPVFQSCSDSNSRDSNAGSSSNYNCGCPRYTLNGTKSREVGIPGRWFVGEDSIAIRIVETRTQSRAAICEMFQVESLLILGNECSSRILKLDFHLIKEFGLYTNKSRPLVSGLVKHHKGNSIPVTIQDFRFIQFKLRDTQKVIVVDGVTASRWISFKVVCLHESNERSQTHHKCDSCEESVRDPDS